MTTSNFTVEMNKAADHCQFRRSDGEEFFLVPAENGHAVLYLGKYSSDRPSVGLVDFDKSIVDKIAAAKRRILVYPNEP